MAESELDPREMNRLAFVRLLFSHGVEQSKQPHPMSAASVLTFHDAVEQFLILAAEHLRASGVRREGGLLQYWEILKPRRGFHGVELSGQHGITRLNRVRNDLKHLGALPALEALDDARAAVAGFLEDSTPKVFGLEFAEINLADLVPQEEIRSSLKAAASFDAAGDHKRAMAILAESVDGLLNLYSETNSSRFNFGHTIRVSARPLIGIEAARLASRLPLKHQRRAAREAANRLDRHIWELSLATAQMQRGLRVLALGLDYSEYIRFEQLAPTFPSLAWEPTHEQYNECVQFVVTIALRIAEVAARAGTSSLV